MRVDCVNTYNQIPVDKRNQQNFGHVIKTRFFEVLPDGAKTQIQDIDTIKSLCKRLTYHLSSLHSPRKGRLDKVPEFFAKVDNDYAKNPLIRRIFNFNKPYDHCFYLITGKDAAALENFARTTESHNRKSKIIENHWKLVRDSGKRMYDESFEELALNIFLARGKHPKTQNDCFFFRGFKLVQERLMHFPHRLRGENLK